MPRLLEGIPTADHFPPNTATLLMNRWQPLGKGGGCGKEKLWFIKILCQILLMSFTLCSRASPLETQPSPERARRWAGRRVQRERFCKGFCEPLLAARLSPPAPHPLSGASGMLRGWRGVSDSRTLRPEGWGVRISAVLAAE